MYESSDDDSEEEFSEKAFRSKESDFSYSSSLFKKSIKSLDRAFAYYSLNHSNENLPFYIHSLDDMDFTYDFIENLHLKSVDEIDKVLQNKSFSLSNPLCSIPLMNMAELKITVNSDTKSIQTGLVYLHIAYKILYKTLNLINKNRNNN